MRHSVISRIFDGDYMILVRLLDSRDLLGIHS